MLNTGLIIIGDEILSGRTQDTNSHYLSRRLNELGITPKSFITISDNKSVIEQTIASAIENNDIVFVAGGLGPTPDDNTIACVANVLNRRLILDELLLTRIEKHFERQKLSIPEIATRQALIPQGAIILDNPVGQAPGLILKHGKKVIVLLPGVPIELQNIFETGVIPFLHDTYNLQPDLMLAFRTTNIPEIEIVQKISDVTKRYKDITVAYLPSVLGVDIKISRIKDKKTLMTLEKEIGNRLKSWIYAKGGQTIEEIIGQICRKKQLTLSIAESCTGGLISDKITNIPGSSEYFIGGAIVYSNKLKQLIGGVKPETIKKFGAVSKETVTELAQGIRQHFNTDIGLSVSGIAGPSGATKEKPIGLVFIGVATKRGSSFEQHNFTGTRRMIKEKSAMAALDFLRRTIESL